MNGDGIERNDFPIARRGYDRDEVHAHLRRVSEGVARLRQEEQQRSRGLADEVERLRREQEGWGVAGSAAVQIREIVGAAERTAEIIRQGAEDDAQESRRQDEIHRGEVRKRAEAQAGEHVARVEEATERLLQQVVAYGSEFESLLEGLRGEAGKLMDGIKGHVESVQADLRQIRGGAPALRSTPGPAQPAAASAPRAAASPAQAEAAQAEAAPAEAAPTPEVDVVGEEEEELPAEEAPDEFEVEPAEPAAEREAEATAPPLDDVAAAVPADEQLEPDAREAPSGEARDEVGTAGAGEDQRAIAGAEGARLIALNMALNGAPRDETARYLSENFDLEDQDAVLDEVYDRLNA